MNVTVLVYDSVTKLPDEAQGAVCRAAISVAAQSARIGDGRSTLQDGTISDANAAAALLGARVGSPALALARVVAEKA